MPNTVCATARTSRTVCFAGLLWSARTWTSTGRPDRSPTTRTAWTPLRRQSSSSSSRSSAAAASRSPSDDDSSFDHSLGMATPSLPEGPQPPPGHSIRPTDHPAWGLALPMLLVGLAWRSDPGETMRSFRSRRTASDEELVSGWRRQGLGLKSTSYLKRSDESVGLTAMPTREIEVSGGLVKRPWFALRPARQHWSQCCSPVALSSGSSKQPLDAEALPSLPHATSHETPNEDPSRRFVRRRARRCAAARRARGRCRLAPQRDLDGDVVARARRPRRARRRSRRTSTSIAREHRHERQRDGPRRVARRVPRVLGSSSGPLVVGSAAALFDFAHLREREWQKIAFNCCVGRARRCSRRPRCSGRSPPVRSRRNRVSELAVAAAALSRTCCSNAVARELPGRA